MRFPRISRRGRATGSSRSRTRLLRALLAMSRSYYYNWRHPNRLQPAYFPHGGTMPGDRAVVIGAGIGGLLAARVLSESFNEVVVLERDTLPALGESRRGVPQGRHTHG